jgi:hypothetical protein
LFIRRAIAPNPRSKVLMSDSPSITPGRNSANVLDRVVFRARARSIRAAGAFELVAPDPGDSSIERAAGVGREMLRSVAGCTAIPRQRSPRARPLHVAASRHGPTTTLQLSGSLHPVDLRVLDDMTVWLLTWDSHRLVVDIDDLTGSDALFTAWICKRQRSARLIGDHVVARTSNLQRRGHLIAAGVVCDAV